MWEIAWGLILSKLIVFGVFLVLFGIFLLWVWAIGGFKDNGHSSYRGGGQWR